MNRNILTFLSGLIFLAFTGCSAIASSSSPDVAPATPTALPPTPTIVWFPPSVTPSPQVIPSMAPTAEQKPGVGNILLQDDFTTSVNWNTGSSDQASVGVSANQLTIAAQPGVAPVVSFRKDMTFNNFYAEITAQPSLCRDGDDYGLLFRAPNNVAYYRFALACNGTAGVERVSLGAPHMLQPPMPSGDAPLGPPGEVRLGVWAAGSQLHFFLNGRYQFGVTDRTYLAGGFGVFAFAAGDTPVTISFSDLVVRAVEVELPTETPMP